MKDRKPFDFWIFMTVMIMLAMGLIMVFSASAPTAEHESNNVYAIIKDQLVFAVIGIVVMLVAANFDYHKLSKLSGIALIGSLVLLVMVITPGIRRNVNETYRWLYLGPIHFQPSEIAKLGIIMFFAYSLSRRKEKLSSFFKGVLPYFGVLGVFLLLLKKEPHMSCMIIISMVALIMLFCAGVKLRHFAMLAAPIPPLLAYVVFSTNYMTDRINSFLNPWSDLQGSGWQTVQSLYAIGSGGLFGRGLGRSMQKFLYLPEPHNDFIFAVLAEELGYIGVLAVLILFLIFIWRGIKVSMSAQDTYGSLLALGITSLIAVQSMLNIAVVTASIPNTGVSLPFFSSGGSSLVLFLLEVGILLNISRYAKYERI